MFRWYSATVAVMLLPAITPAEPPNVVLIFVDDLGYGELGCQGNEQIPTPHIDSIAENGVRFTAGYVSSPYCCPSRAGLMTGRYQTRFGHELNAVGGLNLDPLVGLPPSEITIAELLKDAGYATGLVGKWHLGASEGYHPLKHGFDEFFGFLHEGHFYVPPPVAQAGLSESPEGVVSYLREKEPPYDENNPLLRGTEEVEEKEYLTDALTREAVAFIDRHKEGPFFLYLSYNAVHSPMQATKEKVEQFKHIEDEHRRVFAGMLSSLDDGVGKVLAKLRDAGLEENTLIWFISDNGGPTRELTSSNAPLRGGKGQLWEGGIRVPFLVQWKGTLPAAKVYDYPVISLDVLPTSVKAAGGKIPDDRPIDGVDLLPHLTNDEPGRPHRILYWRYGPNTALRRGDLKLVRQWDRREGATPFQMYDVAADTGEAKDLAKEDPLAVGGMFAEWRRLNSQMVEPRWGR